VASLNCEFWRDKRVLLTGHTGFKGAWLAVWLTELGAKVHGFSLAPVGDENLYQILKTPLISDVHADLRAYEEISKFVTRVKPEIVFHLAAQALVRQSYKDPLETIDTNVMGTANLLSALRECPDLQTVLVVTSDKVYDNSAAYLSGGDHIFRESNAVGGHDPYSASKGMQELVTRSFFDSYFASKNIPVSTARAGNVIGGGDWAEDRLMTDVIAAIKNGGTVSLRNPLATRPWQHVLEPLSGYLLFAQSLQRGATDCRALNFGPDGSHNVSHVVETLLKCWGLDSGWTQDGDPGPQEAKTLTLDSSLASTEIGWRPHLSLEETLTWVAGWFKALYSDQNMTEFTVNQINTFQNRMGGE
jgi:CDP-glucose 4,6-dehydratase